MRAFVTGGTGLVGRHVVEALLERGWDVSVLTRDPTRAGDLADRGVRIVVGDLRQPEFGHELAGVDVLFHAAAWFEVGVRDRRSMFGVNLKGTEQLLALARKELVPRIVYTSTAGLFPGTPESPATESTLPELTVDDPYVASKLAAHELAVREMASGLPVTIVAPGGVFGPRDTNQFAQSLALLVQGRLGTVPNGFGLNTFTHAADVAEGQLLAATIGRPGEMYFLADHRMSMYEFFDAAARAAGVEPPRRRVPMALARMAAMGSGVRGRFTGRTPMVTRAALELAAVDVVIDASKARRELGWSPRPFEERLQATMAWFKQTYVRTGTPLPVKPGGASAAGPSRRA